MQSEVTGCTGVLLINLGTPDAPTPKAVSTYLAEFLDDPRVIDLPTVVRKILLYGFILPFRPKKTAKAYAEIFDPKRGSPLLFHSEDLIREVQDQLGKGFKVTLGMRYGQPSLKGALDALIQSGCQEIVALPLFPQYSSAVNGSAMEALFASLQQHETIPSINVLSEFYQRLEFLDTQAALITECLAQTPKASVIFSYHSLPVRQIRKSSKGCHTACFKGEPCPELTAATKDCYRAKCFTTSKQLAKRLGLQEDQYRVAFQSRLGRTEWIGPDFNSVMKQLRQQGIKDVVVACPSFVVDCLETLEEIGIRGKQDWIALGGHSYQLVPCLNSRAEWAQVVAKWIREATLKSA